jgi:hypothetical protein
MSYDRQKKLVQTLIQKTEGGQLDWKASVNDEAFHISIKENTIQIEQMPREDTVDILISLINDQGAAVDSFTDVDLNLSEPTGQKTWFRVMRGLYESARRTALGSDRVLNKILEDLEK